MKLDLTQLSPGDYRLTVHEGGGYTLTPWNVPRGRYKIASPWEAYEWTNTETGERWMFSDYASFQKWQKDHPNG